MHTQRCIWALAAAERTVSSRIRLLRFFFLHSVIMDGCLGTAPGFFYCPRKKVAVFRTAVATALSLFISPSFSYTIFACVRTMATTKANRDRGGPEAEELETVEPYSMHVSAKYLELTKRKLELTRLPHEILLPEERKWAYGTPKSVLEPLVDYWLTEYDWRTQERDFNAALPQFRTAIPVSDGHSSSDENNGNVLRIHFVHQRARLDGDLTPPRTIAADAATAIPLLFIHDVPASSFLDVSRVIDALTALPGENDDDDVGEDGVMVGLANGGSVGAAREAKEEEEEGCNNKPVAFHVVAPSVPGMGFSDAAKGREGFGAWETAAVFDGLMRRLGYRRYVAVGMGWGFAVCRALALRYGQDRCVAIHAVNPVSFFPPPSLRSTPLAWLKYQVARMTKARIPGLSFEFLPADFENHGLQANIHSRPADEEKAIREPLTDEVPSEELLEGETSGLRRPQTTAFALCDSPAGLLAHTLDTLRPCLVLGRPGLMSSIWSPAMLLNWTMIRWLPGPEAGLRWLQRATRESKEGGRLWRGYSGVPLGISQFGWQRAVGARSDGVLGWADAWQKVHWLKRREGVDAVRPEWEQPEDLVEDLRESFGKAWADRG